MPLKKGGDFKIYFCLSNSEKPEGSFKISMVTEYIKGKVGLAHFNSPNQLYNTIVYHICFKIGTKV